MTQHPALTIFSFLNVDQSRDEGYSCTCKQNAEEFSCVHSVRVAIIRGTLVPPCRAMVTLVGRKKANGSASLGASTEHPAYPEQNARILAGLIQPKL